MAKKISWRLTTLLMVISVIGVGYWYRTTDSTCPSPLSYSIGTLDRRFGLSQSEAQMAVSEAEALWESAVGQELFTYDPGATFTINFIFDDRQRRTVEEHKLRSILDRKAEVSNTIKEEYDILLSKYKTLADTYEIRVTAYETKLAMHNSEVAEWNNNGGAPEDIYERLNTERYALDRESTELNALAGRLNAFVDSINTLGEAGNNTVDDYNDEVETYNSRFTHEREFTEGDYYQGRVNIYQFANRDELRAVLAHELGHALSLGHVEDSKSVMYYLMNGQDAGLSVSLADIAEFERVCNTR